MPQGLSYADAVRLLGGSGPLAKAVDNLLGGVLSVATAGGSDLAISLFDAKTEVVRLGGLVSATINDSVRGLGRYDRSERLQAAHVCLVVAAFFEALDDCLDAAGIDRPGFSREDQLRVVVPGAGTGLMSDLLAAPVPMPAPDVSYAALLDRLGDWFGATAERMIFHFPGLAVWENAGDSARRELTSRLRDRLPGLARDRYDETHRRLAADIPEFAIWADRLEARATAHGLERLESVLRQATSGRDPDRHRAALARAYRAELNRPVLGGDAGDLLLPALGTAYLDPVFRVRAAGPGARPADDHWWTDAATRTDIAAFLAAHLTTTQATEAPMLLLGQPGAGKSSLTRILAARLPASDFFVCRVVLRDVPAEAEIQDQIELALRAAIGETVSWAAIAGTGGALPVVLLDGFDELLQATGLHQSDYLQRVAAFQQREAALGRPVAVMVTSRVAVADRARLPAGALAVRLEPFDDDQIERWLAVWNATNNLTRPLTREVLRPLRHLAEQPLLLLMLALYDGTGHGLRDSSVPLDGGQLYERLLASFAAREVRRVHAGQPDEQIPALVEQELLRLSVVAFAMFHRLRLWVTERELDDDLAGLGLGPSRAGRTEAFRTPLTAGQEMVGRFFFIQRARAVRDDQTLQTYEFLHATFGEYLVARLVVQAVRDTAAREAASTLALRLGPANDDDLLKSLLGYTALTARATILSFVSDLFAGPGRDRLREWLVARTSQAVTRPAYGETAYRPVDKRVDHWMSTYSFNLMLLTLACGGSLRASELFTRAADPAYWMRASALQWRAAIPGDMYMDALEVLTVRREWHEGRRDIVLELALDWAPTFPDPMDVTWFNDHPPGTATPEVHRSEFGLHTLLKSMQLSNSLGDSTMLHALEPLVARVPDALTTFVGDESLAHSLVELWLASALDTPDLLAARYDRVTSAILTLIARGTSAEAAVTLLMQALRADADRLPPARVVGIAHVLVAVPSTRGADLALRSLLTPRVAATDSAPPLMAMLLTGYLEALDDALLAQALLVVTDSPSVDPAKIRDLVRQLDGLDHGRRAKTVESLDPALPERLSIYR
ncbi:hypothetical protein JIG36_40835 [Actinoplanes sp. LDG1-06]|uniref:NACHT N-terminal Helical domain-containing protein n=1 Tax=Paractinoplanes ovalisporus TaxID=2810368 RepID=A0ABS2AQ09_9ACTN|nr:hypothetical protein [Actinoplanes ovalisporus]MBM2621865.1 hypothetical protein [Actinoplanes ovalisporus]